MTTKVRNSPDLLLAAVRDQVARLRLDVLKTKAGTVFHADASVAITSPDASEINSSILLANEIKAKLNTHYASACSASTGQGAHLAADSANVIATADASDLASVQTLLNACKTSYEAHRVLTTCHPTADGTNTITSAAASNQATADTLANEMKADCSAHFAAAFVSPSLAVVGW